MSLRLVRDGDEKDILWFSHSHWKRLLELAAAYGWSPLPKCDPDQWDDSGTMNDKYEWIGCAFVTSEESSVLVAAVSHGLADENGAVLQGFIAEANTQIQLILPERRVDSEFFTRVWREFIAFASRGGFRIDYTD